VFGKCSTGGTWVVNYVEQEGRGWEMFNRRDVGHKCSTGGTCVANVQQKGRVWQIFNRRDVGGTLC